MLRVSTILTTLEAKSKKGRSHFFPCPLVQLSGAGQTPSQQDKRFAASIENHLLHSILEVNHESY